MSTFGAVQSGLSAIFIVCAAFVVPVAAVSGPGTQSPPRLQEHPHQQMQGPNKAVLVTPYPNPTMPPTPYHQSNTSSYAEVAGTTQRSYRDAIMQLILSKLQLPSSTERPVTPDGQHVDQTYNIGLVNNTITILPGGHGSGGSTTAPGGMTTPPSHHGGVVGFGLFGQAFHDTQGPGLGGIVSNGNNGYQQISPVSAGVLCYEDSPVVVQRNIPCRDDDDNDHSDDDMKLRRANLTVQNLAQLLRNEGGGFIGDIVSAVPPQHLHGYELHNIENSAWMNHDKAELITNLESLLVNHNQHQNQLRHSIQQYLSKGRIGTILALGVSLLEALNNSFTVNICPTNLTSPAGNISSQQTAFDTCFVLVSEISKMNSINFQLEESLISSDLSTPAEQVTGGSIRYSTEGGAEGGADYIAINITSDNSIISDDAIDDLLNKLKVVQGTSENIIRLHQRLLNATSSFLHALSAFEHDFFKMLELLKEYNQTKQSEASASYEKLRTDVDIHDRVATTGSIGDNVDVVSTQKWNTQSSLNSSIWNHTGSLPVQLTHTNISNIVELLDILASNLTQFEDLLILANVTRPIHDPMLDTWTDWHNLRRRTKRSAAGFTISGEQCQRQGALINQTNFISLCSTCVHTTVLDNCYFPRFLTEKVCGRGSSSNPVYQNSCLCMPGQIVGGPAGQCQQQRFHIVLLKKTPGRCMKIKSQGQEIITDQWESTTYPLRIGCECVIHQNSMFARYALFP